MLGWPGCSCRSTSPRRRNLEGLLFFSGRSFVAENLGVLSKIWLVPSRTPNLGMDFGTKFFASCIELAVVNMPFGSGRSCLFMKTPLSNHDPTATSQEICICEYVVFCTPPEVPFSLAYCSSKAKKLGRAYDHRDGEMLSDSLLCVRLRGFASIQGTPK